MTAPHEKAPGGDAEKAFANLRARLALAGYELRRTDDDRPAFIISRWGLMCSLRDLAAVEDFVRRVGAA